MHWGEGHFSGVGGIEIYYQYWLPTADKAAGSRAVIAISHGLGEHGRRYRYLADALVNRQFSVFALDHRGHGKSQGRRGYAEHWEDLREDVRTFLGLVRQQAPGQPLFLLGHSLGGLIALDYALVYPQGLQGVVASAPAVTQTAISPVKVLLAKTLSRLLPTLSMKTGLDAQGISRDPQEVQRYLQDPLVHDLGTLRLGAEGFAAQDRTMAEARGFKPALLLVHGDADRLIPLQGSQVFYDRVAHQDKTLLIYPGGYHESHNDLHREQYFADLAAWIQDHF
jgi:alpha-beta hydrolase superfamily lysophospholipase